MSDMNEVNKTNNSAGSGFTNTENAQNTAQNAGAAYHADGSQNNGYSNNSAQNANNNGNNGYLTQNNGAADGRQTTDSAYNAGNGQTNGYPNGGAQNNAGNGYPNGDYSNNNSQNNGCQNSRNNGYQTGRQQEPHYGNYQFHSDGPNPQGPYDFGQSYGMNGGPNGPKPKKDHTKAKKIGVFIGKTAAAALIASVVFTGVFAVAQHTGLISVGGKSADSSQSQEYSSEFGTMPNIPDFGSGNEGGSGNGSGNDGSTDSSASDQSASGPTLGIKAQTVSSDQTDQGYPEGVLVVSVTSGSAADGAGLEKGDVITAFNGSTVDSVEDLKQLLAEAETGKEYKLNYKRADGSSYKAYSTNVTFSDSSDSSSSN